MDYYDHKIIGPNFCCNCCDKCTVNKCSSGRQRRRIQNFEKLRRQWSLVGKTGENCFCRENVKNENILYPPSTTTRHTFRERNSIGYCSECLPNSWIHCHTAHAKDQTRKCDISNGKISCMDNSEVCDCFCSSCLCCHEIECENDSENIISNYVYQPCCNSEMFSGKMSSGKSNNFIVTSECNCQRCELMKTDISLANKTAFADNDRKKNKTVKETESKKMLQFSKTLSATPLNIKSSKTEHSEPRKSHYSRTTEVICDKREKEKPNTVNITAEKRVTSVLSIKRSSTNYINKIQKSCEHIQIKQSQVSLLQKTTTSDNKIQDKFIIELNDKNKVKKTEKFRHFGTKVDVKNDTITCDCINDQKLKTEQKESSNSQNMETKYRKNKIVTAHTLSTLQGKNAQNVSSVKRFTSHENVKELFAKTTASKTCPSGPISKMKGNKSTSCNKNQINKDTEEKHKDEINNEKRLKVSSKSDKGTKLHDKDIGTCVREENGANKDPKGCCAFDIRRSANAKDDHNIFPQNSRTCNKEKINYFASKTTPKSCICIINKACQIPSTCKQRYSSKKNLSYLSARPLQCYMVKQYKSGIYDKMNGIQAGNKILQVNNERNIHLHKATPMFHACKNIPQKKSRDNAKNNTKGGCCRCKYGESSNGKNMPHKKAMNEENPMIISKWNCPLCASACEKRHADSDKRKNDCAKRAAVQTVDNQAVGDAMCKKGKRCKNKSFEEEFLMMKSSTKQQRVRRKWLISEVFQQLILKCGSWLRPHQRGSEQFSEVYKIRNTSNR